MKTDGKRRRVPRDTRNLIMVLAEAVSALSIRNGWIDEGHRTALLGALAFIENTEDAERAPSAAAQQLLDDDARRALR